MSGVGTEGHDAVRAVAAFAAAMRKWQPRPALTNAVWQINRVKALAQEQKLARLQRDVGELEVFAADLKMSNHVFEQNTRVLEHEAHTPMDGHDEDGRCCLRARLGAKK